MRNGQIHACARRSLQLVLLFRMYYYVEKQKQNTWLCLDVCAGLPGWIGAKSSKSVPHFLGPTFAIFKIGSNFNSKKILLQT